jgi:uncharacterized protein (DUF1778 family)
LAVRQKAVCSEPELEALTHGKCNALDLKLDRDDKDLFVEGAPLMGTTIAGFVRTAPKEKARAPIEQERRINLSNRDFAAVTAAFEPNEVLRRAIESARTSVRRA